MDKVKRKYVYVLAFIIPSTIFTLIWNKCGIYPFGEISNMRADLDIQYADLYAYLQNVFRGEASLSYSFTKALGGSCIALFAYYLASPVNILLAVFNQEDMQMFVYIASVLKIGLCGLFQALFLKKRFVKLKDFEVLVLSMCFAVSYYNINQVENLMWMDGVYMLPLILCGVWSFLENRRGGIFLAVTAAASILFNWYTAYMNCLFASIYFLFELLKKNGLDLKFILKKTFWFACYMLLGILLSSVLFLPNLYGLLRGKGSAEENIFNFAVNGNLAHIMRGFVLGNDPGSNMLSLFCGSSILLLAVTGMVFLYKKAKKEFVLSVLFLTLMFISLFLKPLENVWNGFRYATSYMYRFSYLQTWLLVYFAAVGLVNYARRQYTIFKVSAGCILSWIVLDYMVPFDGYFLYLTYLYVILMSLGWYVYKTYSANIASAGCLLIWGVAVIELCVNGNAVCSKYAGDAQFYVNYVSQQKQLIDTVKSMDRQEFYRMEQTVNREFSQNKNSAYFLESMAYDYHSFSHYTSTFDENVKKLGSSLGYGENTTVSMYDEPILTSDSLLGIKYVLADAQYPQLNRKSDQIYNGKQIYENPYALPVGFGVSESCMEAIDQGNHFEFQNALYSKLLGRDVQLYQPVQYQVVSHGENEITYGADLTEGCILYGYADSGVGNLELFIDDQYRCRYQGWLSYRVFNIGETVGTHYVRFENFNGSEEQIQPWFYQLDLKLFQEVVEELKSSVFELETFEDGLVEGKYHAGEDGWVLLTIPSEKGWAGKVNGESVSLQSGANALMMVPVKSGENHIVLKYHVPFLKTGFIMTVLAGIVLTMFGCKDKLQLILKNIRKDAKTEGGFGV